MTDKTFTKVNATLVHERSFDGWSLDHDRIRTFIKSSRTMVADADRLYELARLAAIAVGVSTDFVVVLLKLEVGYPADYEVYRSTMRGGFNNAYVGVTQMYNGFWTDVRTHYKFTSELPSRRDETTLEMQLVAPFLYAERYKKGLIRQRYPLSPAVLYVAHQRGGPAVGLPDFGTTPITDKQSGPSMRVVNAVRKFSRDKRPMQDVYL